MEGEESMTTEKKDIAVMTIAYNKGTVLEKCIRGFIRGGTKCSDIYVVDNGSTDDILSITKKCRVHYLRLDKNHFISHALNVGFEHFHIAQNYCYFLISGSDVLVDTKTVFEQVSTLRADKNIGMTGPAHFDIESNTLMNYGVTIGKITSILQSNLDPQKTHGMNHFHSMYTIRADVYKKVGGLDAILFPMIFEEPDIGERIIAQGHTIVTSPKAHIWHSLDHASKVGNGPLHIRKERLYNNVPKAYLFFRNRIIYMSLHSTLPQFALFILFIHPLMMLYYLPSIEPRYISFVFQGVIDGLVFACLKNRAYISQRNTHVLQI